jgi:tRNA threonylcarbamoyladenosine biosynthesis protein TsaB
VRILALETTERVGTVAVVDDAKPLREVRLQDDRRSTESLAPAVASLLEAVDWQPSSVQLVAVTVGPGSFTGLRVGIAFAKAFAYAAGSDILGIDTLETIAAGLQQTGGPIAVAVDAQRGDLVGAVFEADADGRVQVRQPARLMPIDTWFDRLPPGATVAGPLLRKVASRVPPGLTLAEPRFWIPRASVVGFLADAQYRGGRRDDVWELVPQYSRRSAAEEKWLRHNPGDGDG